MPANPVEKKRWISLIRRGDREPSEHSLVCDCHFVNRDRKNGPTIFERNLARILGQQIPKKRKMPGAACAVASCRSSYYNESKQGRKDLMFFRFPKDHAVQKEWIKRCYRKDQISPQNHRICSKHFKPNDFVDEVRAKLMGWQAKSLKKDAIPSLCLTPEEETLEKDCQITIPDNKTIVKIEDDVTSVEQTPIGIEFIELIPESLQPLEENANLYISYTCKLEEETQMASNNNSDEINMPGCAAVGCSNSAKKGFIMKRFPKDPKRRKEWTDRLNRDEWSPTDCSALCEVHFSPEMWETVREDGTRKLKHDAIPTIFNAGCPQQGSHSSWKSETSEPIENIRFETNSPFARTAFLETEPTLGNINESILKSTDLIKKEAEPLDDSEFDPNESPNKVCRVCLETNAKTVSLLHLNPDYGRNINSIFQEILGETKQQIYDLKMPQQICDSCLYHLDHAYNFKKTYGKTMQIRESSLSKESEKDKYYNSTLCRICLDPAELPFALELTLDDESTLDVVNVFQDLTGETSEQIYDSTTPQRICDKCPDSLVYAYHFKKALKTSTQVLRDSLSNTDSFSKTGNFVSKDMEEKNDLFNENLVKTDDNVTNKEIENDALGNVDETLDEYIEDPSETDDNVTNKEIENKFFENANGTLDEYSKDISETEDNSTNGLNNIGEKQIKLHKCPICLEKFSALELKQHCKSHDSLKIYFSRAPLLKKKVRFYAKPKNNICLFYRDTVRHTCPFCLKAFDGKDFRNHVKTHKTDGTFKCIVCDRKFLGRNHLKRHQLSHRKETPFECEMCGKGFFLKKNFDFHQFHHTIPLKLPFPCEYCSKSFANPEHLKRHNFSHEKSMSYRTYYTNKQNFLACKQCQQKFKTEEELQEHICTMICAKCLKPFTNKKELTNHGCQVERLQYVCGCGKEFRTLFACKHHACKMRRKDLCSICGKDVTNLKQHLLIHYPVEDRFSCDVCGKKFKYRESIWRHKIAVHRPPETFKCQYCEKPFKNKIYMKNHEKIHTRKKEHICEICGSKFLYKVYLTRHQKVHKDMTEESEDESIVVSNKSHVCDDFQDNLFM